MDAFLQDKLDKISEKLLAIVDTSPMEFKVPIDFMMSLGGKRLRPLLCMLGYELFYDDSSTILTTACALEVFHNFTLIHDDIMDNSPLRRGKPTIYKKWGNSTTILVGDVMLIKAYQEVLKAKNNPNRLMTRLNETAIEVCRGQQQDMNFETMPIISENDYIEMIRLKTAVLIGFSLEAGGILANQNAYNCDLLYKLGEKIGIAFQLKDDWLDTYGDTTAFGKKIGNDILTNKKTHLLVYALNKGNDAEVNELRSLLESNKYENNEKISRVKSIYEKLHVSLHTETKMNNYFDDAYEILNQLNCKEATKENLLSFFKSLSSRSR